MALLLGFALLLVPQDLKETHGKSYAQILAMGRDRWSDFYTTKEGGESTATMSDAESIFGDALGWRNDRFGKAKVAKLRKILQDTARDACEVGSAISGGGTMWNIIAPGLETDGEQTLYLVLSGKGRTRRHVVSDVEKKFALRKKDLAASDFSAERKKLGQSSLVLLRKDLDRLIAEAARRPRRDSDALLDFGVKCLLAGDLDN